MRLSHVFLSIGCVGGASPYFIRLPYRISPSPWWTVYTHPQSDDSYYRYQPTPRYNLPSRPPLCKNYGLPLVRVQIPHLPACRKCVFGMDVAYTSMHAPEQRPPLPTLPRSRLPHLSCLYRSISSPNEVWGKKKGHRVHGRGGGGAVRGAVG